MEAITRMFKDQPIRVVMKDNEPWFIVKDICDTLGLTNPTKTIQGLDDDEKANFKLGRGSNSNAVNESGMYCLIFKSRKPEAKAFKRWVTHEVLPSIRKTGSYSAPGTRKMVNGMTTAKIAHCIGIQPASLTAWLETYGMIKREGNGILPAQKAEEKYAGSFEIITTVYHAIKWTPKMADLIMRRYRHFVAQEPKLLEGGAK